MMMAPKTMARYSVIFDCVISIGKCVSLYFFSLILVFLCLRFHIRYKGTEWNMHENDHFIVIYACHIHFIRHFNYIIVDDMHEITLSQQRFWPLQCLYQSQRTNWLNSNQKRVTFEREEFFFAFFFFFNLIETITGQRGTTKFYFIFFIFFWLSQS